MTARWKEMKEVVKEGDAPLKVQHIKFGFICWKAEIKSANSSRIKVIRFCYTQTSYYIQEYPLTKGLAASSLPTHTATFLWKSSVDNPSTWRDVSSWEWLLVSSHKSKKKMVHEASTITRATVVHWQTCEREGGGRRYGLKCNFLILQNL